MAIGAFVGLFLLLFQPFGLYDWHTPAKTLKILGFGGITLIVVLVNYFVLPSLFPHYFSNKRWTVGKEIIRVLLFITVIALGNRFYLGWLLDTPLEAGGWLWAIGVTFLIGLFPSAGLILLNYVNQLKKYSQSASDLPIPERQPDNGQQALLLNQVADHWLALIADNEKDTLTLRANELLFIESSDNYCTVYFLENGLPDQVMKPLLRSSLSRLIKQVNQPHVVRCHRSFAVNLDRVERITGNAQGYKLHLLEGQFRIPVARQYNETLVAELKAL